MEGDIYTRMNGRGYIYENEWKRIYTRVRGDIYTRKGGYIYERGRIYIREREEGGSPSLGLVALQGLYLPLQRLYLIQSIG